MANRKSERVTAVASGLFGVAGPGLMYGLDKLGVHFTRDAAIVITGVCGVLLLVSLGVWVHIGWKFIRRRGRPRMAQVLMAVAGLLLIGGAIVWFLIENRSYVIAVDEEPQRAELRGNIPQVARGWDRNRGPGFSTATFFVFVKNTGAAQSFATNWKVIAIENAVEIKGRVIGNTGPLVLGTIGPDGKEEQKVFRPEDNILVKSAQPVLPGTQIQGYLLAVFDRGLDDLVKVRKFLVSFEDAWGNRETVVVVPTSASNMMFYPMIPDQNNGGTGVRQK